MLSLEFQIAFVLVSLAAEHSRNQHDCIVMFIHDSDYHLSQICQILAHEVSGKLCAVSAYS